MQPRTLAYVKLHIAVLLFGVTAILGKLISLEALSLVWNRLWISFLVLALLPGVLKGLRALSRAELLRFSGIGVLICIHWVTFYGSIKLGNNASITLACLATTTLFTSFLEPWITKSRFQATEMLIGIGVIFGIYLITGVGKAYYPAIVVGLISAFFAALFSVLNKKYIGTHKVLSISFLELSSGFIVLSLVLVLRWIAGNDFDLKPVKTDWIYLLLLGIFCTSLAFALSLDALKELSAFISNLSINLEPVYGILLAAAIFKESDQLNASFYFGTAIILGAVVVHPLMLRVDRQYKERKLLKNDTTSNAQ